MCCRKDIGSGARWSWGSSGDGFGVEEGEGGDVAEDIFLLNEMDMMLSLIDRNRRAV